MWGGQWGVGIYEASNKEIIEEKETKGNNMCNTKWLYIGLKWGNVLL